MNKLIRVYLGFLFVFLSLPVLSVDTVDQKEEIPTDKGLVQSQVPEPMTVEIFLDKKGIVGQEREKILADPTAKICVAKTTSGMFKRVLSCQGGARIIELIPLPSVALQVPGDIVEPEFQVSPVKVKAEQKPENPCPEDLSGLLGSVESFEAGLEKAEKELDVIPLLEGDAQPFEDHAEPSLDDLKKLKDSIADLQKLSLSLEELEKEATEIISVDAELVSSVPVGPKVLVELESQIVVPEVQAATVLVQQEVVEREIQSVSKLTIEETKVVELVLEDYLQVHFKRNLVIAIFFVVSCGSIITNIQEKRLKKKSWLADSMCESLLFTALLLIFVWTFESYSQNTNACPSKLIRDTKTGDILVAPVFNCFDSFYKYPLTKEKAFKPNTTFKFVTKRPALQKYCDKMNQALANLTITEKPIVFTQLLK